MYQITNNNSLSKVTLKISPYSGFYELICMAMIYKREQMLF